MSVALETAKAEMEEAKSLLEQYLDECSESCFCVQHARLIYERKCKIVEMVKNRKL